ncbi:MAG TPA: FAD:protein FMN transferase [Methylomirabilota bacterium]|nr:FAD:protein FMN transferase [Methylomirabilota bacterium]
MATRFEILIEGLDDSRARAAAEEALDEIERLDRQLSAFNPSSEIFRLNTRGGGDWVRLSPNVFSLLKQARELSAATEGAFDITIGPLLRCWGFMREDAALPSDEQRERARELVGMTKLLLDEATYSARFERDGMSVDLGAIGKGHALDQAAAILREIGVNHALAHGGTSTAIAIGPRMDGMPWQIQIAQPEQLAATNARAKVELKDAALSVSAVWGKSIERDGRTYGHVLDPRTGVPVQSAQLAAVICDSATESDALSTALLTLGSSGLEIVKTFRPQAECILA